MAVRPVRSHRQQRGQLPAGRRARQPADQRLRPARGQSRRRPPAGRHALRPPGTRPVGPARRRWPGDRPGRSRAPRLATGPRSRRPPASTRGTPPGRPEDPGRRRPPAPGPALHPGPRRTDLRRSRPRHTRPRPRRKRGIGPGHPPAPAPPPTWPVFPPCGTTGRPASVHRVSTAATSAVSRGRTTAGVCPWKRPVQSTAKPAVASPVRTCGSPTILSSDRTSAPGSVITRSVSLANWLRDKVIGLTATVRLNTERTWSTTGVVRRWATAWPAPARAVTPTCPGSLTSAGTRSLTACARICVRVYAPGD